MTRLPRVLLSLALLALVPACNRRAPDRAAEPPVVVIAPVDEGAIPPPRAVPPAAEPSDAADAMELTVIARANGLLKVQYPPGQRVVLGPANDDAPPGKLVLPVNRPVKFTCVGDETPAAFEIPAFALAVEVKVAKYSSKAVKPTRTGEFGVWNGRRVGTVVVVSDQEFDAWLQGTGPLPGEKPVDGSLAHTGRKLFLKLQCAVCHSGTANAMAPNLEGLYGKKVALKGGGAEIADDQYIRQSIRQPKAKVVEGWEPIMPPFDKEKLTDEEMVALVAYVRLLKPGDTPVRHEPVPKPVGPPK